RLTMTIIFIAVLLVLVFATSIVLFFVGRRSTTSSSNPSPFLLSEDMAAPSQSQLNTSAPLTPPSPMPNGVFSQESAYSVNDSLFSDKGANQATRSTRFDGSLSNRHYEQSSPTASAYTHSQYEFSQRTTAKSPPLAFYELEQEYERGMQATYDPYLDATHLVLSNVVMKTPAEVDLAFQVCARKIQT